MESTGSVRRDVRALERATDRRASERHPAREIFDENASGTREERLIDAERSQATRRCGGCPWCEQLCHPTCVGRGHEVERPPHRPRAEDTSLRDGPLDVMVVPVSDAQADGPQRAEIVLGLNGTEPRNQFFGPRERRSGNTLGGESPLHEVRRQHGLDYHRGRGGLTTRDALHVLRIRGSSTRHRCAAASGSRTTGTARSSR